MAHLYRPPNLIRALKPYHYPEDEDGNPVPSPGVRVRPQSSAAQPGESVQSAAATMPAILDRSEPSTRT